MPKNHNNIAIFTGLIALLFGTTTLASVPTRVLKGIHTSSCTPIQLQGGRSYTRLALSFLGRKYASSETLYSDPKCEISLLETTSQGTWSVRSGKVLNLRLSRMQMRPLDPRIADRMSDARTCGKSWENGAKREILRTPCGKGRRADYFLAQSPSGKSIQLYDCEGRRTVDKGCTHYPMSRTRK
jgi:hypothetical protein